VVENDSPCKILNTSRRLVSKGSYTIDFHCILMGLWTNWSRINHELMLFGFVLIGIGVVMIVRSHLRAVKKPKTEEEFRHDDGLLLGLITLLFGCMFVFAGWSEGQEIDLWCEV
jgi:hypothetical protein